MVQTQCVILRNHRLFAHEIVTMYPNWRYVFTITSMWELKSQCNKLIIFTRIHRYKTPFISNSTEDCFLLVLFFLPLVMLIPLFKIPAYFSHLQLVFFDFFFCFCFGLYKCKITITIINWFILFNRLKNS